MEASICWVLSVGSFKVFCILFPVDIHIQVFFSFTENDATVDV